MQGYEQLTPDLIHRYNRPGPRYTSYPTVPEWETGSFGESFAEFLKREGQHSKPLSLYIHLPFCSRLCTFCGCNQFITRDQNLVEQYLDVLELEAERVADHLGGRQRVQQLHLGGGTPTHLKVPQLQRLWEILARYFEIDLQGEIALEAHPRVTTAEHLEALYELGFRRISLGVQDLDAKVQHAINRDQTLEQTERTFSTAKGLGYTSINLDLVYGLPFQTVQTFETTMNEVLRMGPDRLAIYSFAYIPNMFRTHERAIKPEYLPSPEEKIAIYLASIHFWLEAGYAMIGMDHYAKPEDELALAQHNHTLHRNFMGYTTLKGLSQIGLGVSSISDFGDGYFQHEKDLHAYMQRIKAGELPMHRRKVLDQDDLLRRELIETLMCQGEISISALETKYNIDFIRYFESAWAAMTEFEAEGFLIKNAQALTLTPLGRLFMRNIAMPFDRYLQQSPQTTHFSKTV